MHLVPMGHWAVYCLFHPSPRFLDLKKRYIFLVLFYGMFVFETWSHYVTLAVLEFAL